MTAAVIAGAHLCKTHETLYTYDGTWEQADGPARWAAQFFYDKRVASTSGEVAVQPGIDAGGSVVAAITAYIDDHICTSACAKRFADKQQ